jgi:hypothetical protein
VLSNRSQAESLGIEASISSICPPPSLFSPIFRTIACYFLTQPPHRNNGWRQKKMRKERSLAGEANDREAQKPGSANETKQFKCWTVSRGVWRWTRKKARTGRSTRVGLGQKTRPSWQVALFLIVEWFRLAKFKLTRKAGRGKYSWKEGKRERGKEDTSNSKKKHRQRTRERRAQTVRHVHHSRLPRSVHRIVSQIRCRFSCIAPASNSLHSGSGPFLREHALACACPTTPSEPPD